MSNKQMTINDMERDVLREVVRSLEACKIANQSAYKNNVFWKMGFDTAYQVIVREIKRGDNNEINNRGN